MGIGKSHKTLTPAVSGHGQDEMEILSAPNFAEQVGRSEGAWSWSPVDEWLPEMGGRDGRTEDLCRALALVTGTVP